MCDRDPAVVFIAGYGRSGSTLLAELLGSTPGSVNVGEAARHLLDREMRARGIPCACGEPITDCSFWKEIADQIEAAELDAGTKYARIRYVPAMLLGIEPGAVGAGLRRVRSRLRQILREIAGRSGCSRVIDSSKNPATGLLLATCGVPALCVVHVVRDPRAAVASARRAKHYLIRHSAILILLWWLSYHLFSEALRLFASSYVRIRYEDFVAAPEETLQRILLTIGIEESALRDVLAGRTPVARNHGLAGNPERTAGRVVRIQQRPWSIPRRLHFLTACLTLPLMYRYGYLRRYS